MGYKSAVPTKELSWFYVHKEHSHIWLISCRGPYNLKFHYNVYLTLKTLKIRKGWKLHREDAGQWSSPLHFHLNKIKSTSHFEINKFHFNRKDSHNLKWIILKFSTILFYKSSYYTNWKRIKCFLCFKILNELIFLFYNISKRIKRSVKQ